MTTKNSVIAAINDRSTPVLSSNRFSMNSEMVSEFPAARVYRLSRFARSVHATTFPARMLPPSNRVTPPSVNARAGTTNMEPLLAADEPALSAAVTALSRRLPRT